MNAFAEEPFFFFVDTSAPRFSVYKENTRKIIELTDTGSDARSLTEIRFASLKEKQNRESVPNYSVNSKGRNDNRDSKSDNFKTNIKSFEENCFTYEETERNVKRSESVRAIFGSSENIHLLLNNSRQSSLFNMPECESIENSSNNNQENIDCLFEQSKQDASEAASDCDYKNSNQTEKKCGDRHRNRARSKTSLPTSDRWQRAQIFSNLYREHLERSRKNRFSKRENKSDRISDSSFSEEGFYDKYESAFINETKEFTDRAVDKDSLSDVSGISLKIDTRNALTSNTLTSNGKVKPSIARSSQNKQSVVKTSSFTKSLKQTFKPNKTHLTSQIKKDIKGNHNIKTLRKPFSADNRNDKVSTSTIGKDKFSKLHSVNSISDNKRIPNILKPVTPTNQTSEKSASKVASKSDQWKQNYVNDRSDRSTINKKTEESNKNLKKFPQKSGNGKVANNMSSFKSPMTSLKRKISSEHSNSKETSVKSDSTTEKRMRHSGTFVSKLPIRIGKRLLSKDPPIYRSHTKKEDFSKENDIPILKSGSQHSNNNSIQKQEDPSFKNVNHENDSFTESDIKSNTTEQILIEQQKILETFKSLNETDSPVSDIKTIGQNDGQTADYSEHQEDQSKSSIWSDKYEENVVKGGTVGLKVLNMAKAVREKRKRDFAKYGCEKRPKIESQVILGMNIDPAETVLEQDDSFCSITSDELETEYREECIIDHYFSEDIFPRNIVISNMYY